MPLVTFFYQHHNTESPGMQIKDILFEGMQTICTVQHAQKGSTTLRQAQGERFYNHDYISIPFMVIMSLSNDRTMYGKQSCTYSSYN